MTEENLNTEAIAEPTDNPVDATGSDTPDTTVIDEGSAPSGDDSTDADSQKGGAQKRITELNSKWREEQAARAQADSEAAYWRGVAEGRQSQPAAAQQQAAPEPKEPALTRDQFDTDQEYEQALTERVTQKVEKKLTVDTEQQAMQRKIEKRNNQIMEAAKEMPEIINIGSGQPFMTATMLDAADGDAFAKVFNHLGKNRAEAARIAALPAHQQIKEITRIEDRLKAAKPPPKTTTSAPDPSGDIAPNVSTVVTKDINKMPREEKFALWEKKRLEGLGVKT
jgi:hypothetical protein